jgi:S-DNA-T family DNA segregation ATPase FtsK/SpoIIIE
MAEPIGQRARKLREEAGRLTGAAAGMTPAFEHAPTFDLLADVRRVMAELGADWIWSQMAAERLGELRPEVYRGWTADAFGQAMKGRGVPTKQINRTGPGSDVTCAVSSWVRPRTRSARPRSGAGRHG